MHFGFYCDVIIGGLILGGLYGLTAVGLSLQYGVARVLNVSHGEFIMLGAFAAYSLYTILGINPLLSLVITGPLIFVLAFAIHRIMFQRIRRISPTAGAFEGNSLLASFGLLFIIQNIALLSWGPNVKGYHYLSQSVRAFGNVYAVNRLVAFGLALCAGIAFYLFLVRTRLGKAIRAAAQDRDTAQLVGINIHRVLGLCFSIGAFMAVLAGSLVSMMFEITPNIGLPYTIIAIIAVVLGGLGNILGSLIGGLILGLVGNVVMAFSPALSLVAYYIIFLLLILLRPTGILGK